jgi:hypothetical protein
VRLRSRSALARWKPAAPRARSRRRTASRNPYALSLAHGSSVAGSGASCARPGSAAPEARAQSEYVPAEPAAQTDAATLATLDLALEGRTSAVLGGEALHGRDQVLAGEQAGADRNEHGALGENLRLRSPVRGLGGARRARRSAPGAGGRAAGRAPRAGRSAARAGGAASTGAGCLSSAGALGGGPLGARAAGSHLFSYSRLALIWETIEHVFVHERLPRVTGRAMKNS